MNRTAALLACSSIALGLSLAACSGDVFVDPVSTSQGAGGSSADGAPGVGGSTADGVPFGGSTGDVVPGVGGSTSDGVPWTTGANGGSSGDVSPAGGTGGGGSGICTHGAASFDVMGVDAQGQAFGCTAPSPSGAPQKVSITGAIQSLGATEWVIDSCSPAADCTPQLSKFAFSAPVPGPTIADGTFVRLDVEIENQGASCTRRMLLQSVDSWGGLDNPGLTGVVWIAGGDGDYQTIAGSPFQIEAIGLACGVPPGPDLPKTYDLRFYPTGNPGASGSQVGQGETKGWEVEGNTEGELLEVTNLRAYDSETQGGAGAFGYVVTFAGLVNGDSGGSH